LVGGGGGFGEFAAAATAVLLLVRQPQNFHVANTSILFRKNEKILSVGFSTIITIYQISY